MSERVDGPRSGVHAPGMFFWMALLACSETTDPPDAAPADATTDAARDAGSAEDAGAPRDAGGSTDAGGGACTPACGEGRDCCGGACVNTQNDPRHCGMCGRACPAEGICLAGSCADRPCTTACAAGEVCCGTECCGAGEICCDPQGPIDRGPTCVTPSAEGTCPQGCAPLCMCADPATPVATPGGDRAIASLRVGDLVYSVDRDAIVVVPVARVRRTPVTNHHVVHVVLANGAELFVSGRHPTADGRAFSDLRAGDDLGGVEVVAAAIVPYDHAATHDILPASSTGAYFAGGALIGSTLR